MTLKASHVNRDLRITKKCIVMHTNRFLNQANADKGRICLVS